ncbi:GMC oxidoreductase [Luteolibacter algae]|uniref:GMC oxidoreductase n=1 Tax=Luteolibacter algae TaxID=454151 RepID=A0ABW5DEM7_9BACT
MNLNIKGKAEHTFDAIVVGSGMSGGWAAKELCEKGLKTLVLERGRDLKHIVDYDTTNSPPWELQWQNKASREMKERQHKQARTGYTIKPATNQMFVDDIEHPYEEKKPFDWMRGYHKGGRSLMWGKQSYRLSPMDMEANAKEGISIPWPIKYEELAPWYDYVERFAGISGSIEGLEQLPDGIFQPPMDLTPPELDLKASIEKKWRGRTLIPGRVAHLTAPTAEQLALGRSSCMYRNLCSRGCPFGAYFSSQAATLKAAENTGNMTLRPHSIVHSVIFDDKSSKAIGVRLIDELTMETTEYYAKIIFLNASTIASTAILMNSKSDRFPEGMDESGSLGKYLMDHHLRVGASAVLDTHPDKIHYGRRPNGFYIPRYRNFKEEPNQKYLRGFGYQGGAMRQNWSRNIEGFGAEFKKELTSFGPWSVGMGGFGECLPYENNQIYFSKDKTDKWGLPVIVADAEYQENEHNMRIDMMNDAAEMLESMGAENIRTNNSKPIIGLGIHEMGTARMGSSPKESVLNRHNQVWGAENVFCTDGAAMVSAGCQNPSLTYMALTARAADFAVSEMRKGNL